MNYQKKYLKYKFKFIQLKNQLGGRKFLIKIRDYEKKLIANISFEYDNFADITIQNIFDKIIAEQFRYNDMIVFIPADFFTQLMFNCESGVNIKTFSCVHTDLL